MTGDWYDRWLDGLILSGKKSNSTAYKKFELMLTRHSKAYSSSSSVV